MRHLQRPRWTKYAPLEQGGANEDPLGLYAYALRLLRNGFQYHDQDAPNQILLHMVCGGLQLIEDALSDRLSTFPAVMLAEHSTSCGGNACGHCPTFFCTMATMTCSWG